MRNGLWLILLIIFVEEVVCDIMCEPCNKENFWLDWSQWSKCNRPNCVNGTRNRGRAYNNPFACDNCRYESEFELCHLCGHSCDHFSGNCFCKKGYTLQLDNKTCSVSNFCDNNGGCDHICRNKENGFECGCREKYYLHSDKKTCLALKCNEIRANTCPSNSYTDQFGSVCDTFYESCASRSVVDGRCILNCKNDYGLAIITPSKDMAFGENLLAVNFTAVRDNATCVYNAKEKNVTWDIEGTSLKNYYCRRLNDPPKSINLSKSTILEHSGLYQDIGVLSVSDDKNQRITFTLEKSEGINKFRIKNNILQNVVVFSLSAMQYNDSINVMIRATDNGQPIMFSEKLITITVINVNESPDFIQISNNQLTALTELGSVVGSLSAIDPDYSMDVRLSDKLNWNLIDNGRHFKVEGSNVIFIKRFTRTGNFLYKVVVICSDNDDPPSSTTKEIYIQYNDNNLHPINLTLNTVTLLENVEVNSIVGRLSVIDAENHMVTFVDSSSEIFKNTFRIGSAECKSVTDENGISQTRCTAALILKKKLNFESQRLYVLRVKAIDEMNAFVYKEFALDVVDLNEAPYLITIQYNKINRSAAVGSLAGEIQVFDEDLNSKHTCVVINNVPFYFRGLNIILRSSLKTASISTYNVQVKCFDDGTPPLSLIKIVSIHVEECSSNVYVNCSVNPCDVSTCVKYPLAQCLANYCGGCYAEFYVNGEQVQCSKTGGLRGKEPPILKTWEVIVAIVIAVVVIVMVVYVAVYCHKRKRGHQNEPVYTDVQARMHAANNRVQFNVNGRHDGNNAHFANAYVIEPPPIYEEIEAPRKNGGVQESTNNMYSNPSLLPDYRTAINTEYQSANINTGEKETVHLPKKKSR